VPRQETYSEALAANHDNIRQIWPANRT